jgi:hypothetical protein
MLQNAENVNNGSKIKLSTSRARITFAWIWGLTGITFAWIWGLTGITFAWNKINMF